MAVDACARFHRRGRSRRQAAYAPADAHASAQTASVVSVPHQQATGIAATGSAVRPGREVFGFALASSLSDPNLGYPSWNFSALSTVAFFGLHVASSGVLS